MLKSLNKYFNLKIKYDDNSDDENEIIENKLYKSNNLIKKNIKHIESKVSNEPVKRKTIIVKTVKNKIDKLLYNSI